MTDLSIATSSTSPHALSTDGAPVPIHWVEDLFKRLTAIVGSTIFTTVYAGADPDLVKQQWAEALASFSADEIRRGIAATRTRRFPPNLPEFLHLCRPALDPELAWAEAEAGLRSHGNGERFAWSHPAVYWAARTLSYEVRSSTFAHCRKRWELLLSQEWAKGAWASPPDPTQKALPVAPTQAAADPAVVEAARLKLQRLREKLTGHATKADQDAALLRAEQHALQQPEGDAA